MLFPTTRILFSRKMHEKMSTIRSRENFENKSERFTFVECKPWAECESGRQKKYSDSRLLVKASQRTQNLSPGKGNGVFMRESRKRFIDFCSNSGVGITFLLPKMTRRMLKNMENQGNLERMQKHSSTCRSLAPFLSFWKKIVRLKNLRIWIKKKGICGDFLQHGVFFVLLPWRLWDKNRKYESQRKFEEKMWIWGCLQ